jgi:hypothetical protein
MLVPASTRSASPASIAPHFTDSPSESREIKANCFRIETILLDVGISEFDRRLVVRATDDTRPTSTSIGGF